MPSIRKLFRYLLALVLITTLIIGSFIQPRSYLSKHSSGTLLDSLNPLGAYQEELVLSWKGRLPLVPGTENLTVAENGFDAALLSPPLGNNSLTETMDEFKDPTCQCRKLEVCLQIETRLFFHKLTMG